MACIIQTSDWHLGLPFGNAIALAEELRRGQADCVGIRMPEAISAQRSEVDVILVAGDIFDSSEGISEAVVTQATKAFNKLAEIAPVVVIPGNHDEPIPSSVWEQVRKRQLHTNVKICLEKSVFRVPGTKVVILAVPALANESLQDAIDWCAAKAKDLQSDDIPIGLAHGGAIDFNSQGVSTIEMLNFTPLKDKRIPYMALGDWHSYLEVPSTGRRVAYSGAPEPLKCNDCDYGVGVVLKCTVTSRDNPPLIEKIPVGKVSWFSMEFTLEANMSAEDAVKSLEKEIITKAGSSAKAQSAIIRLRVLGNGLDTTISEIKSVVAPGGTLAGSVLAFIPDVDFCSVTSVANQASRDEIMTKLSPRMKRTLEGVLKTTDANVREEAERLLFELTRGKL